MQDFIQKYKLWIVGAIVGVAFLYPRVKDMDIASYFSKGGSATITNLEEVDEPSEELKSLVMGLEGVVVGDDSVLDKKIISQFYAQLSKIIENSDFVETTQQFRMYNMDAGKLSFSGLSMSGKYPNLSSSIDSIIVKAIGKKNEKLTSEMKKDLSQSLSAISWVMNQ